MKVICDTNIWYGIGEGKIDPGQLGGGAKLVATFYALEELTTTPNLDGNFPIVRRACKAIYDHSDHVIIENAMLHLARSIDPSFVDERNSIKIGEMGFKEVSAIGSLPYDFVLTPELAQEYYKNIKSREAMGKEVALFDNAFIERVRRHSKDLFNLNESEYLKKRFAGIIFEINEYLKEFTDGKVSIEEANIRNCELFFTALLQFYRDAEVSTLKIKPNDAYDLFNLIYVHPGDKYFTKEARWKRIINDAGMSHYLFEEAASEGE